jgi:hypothetical protein
MSGIYLEGTGSEDVDWINLAQNKFKWRDFVKTGKESSGSIKGGESVY